MRISDWSSDVCSSDLDGLYAGKDGNAIQIGGLGGAVTIAGGIGIGATGSVAAKSKDKAATAIRIGSGAPDRQSVVEGKRVSVRVVLGGGRIIKKQNKQKHLVYNITRSRC